jgi:excisionase family DNA binding protein
MGMNEIKPNPAAGTAAPAPGAGRRYDRKAYSPDEAAEAYGLGRSFIYEQISDGHLVAKKAGARTLIKASVLEVWFENLPESTKAKRRAA